MPVTAFENLRPDMLPRVPPDIQQAQIAFNANCGPISFAALMGVHVIDVAKFFPKFPDRNITTWADMRYALECCGPQFKRVEALWPSNGLALVQLDGPWTRAGTPVRAQLCYTHWVACRDNLIFDLNLNDWLEKEEWLGAGAMSWMQLIKGCTGFHLRDAFSVTPQPFEFCPYGRVPLRTER